MRIASLFKSSWLRVSAMLAVVACLAMPQRALSGADASPKQPRYKIRWLVAHGPYNLIKPATDYFAETVKKESNGEIEVEVVIPVAGFKKNALKPEDALTMLADDQYEMSQNYTTIIGNLDHKYWVLDVPFLFKNHKHARRVLDGPIGQELLAELPDVTHSIRGLAFTYSGGYRLIATTGKRLESADDFKGLKMPDYRRKPVAKATMEALGATLVKATKADFPNFLTAGTVEGFESTYTRHGDLSKEDQGRARVINETNHSLFLTAILVNEKFYQSLPPEYQRLLKKVADETAQRERRISIQAGKDVRETLIKDGLTIVAMPAAETEKMEKITAPVAKQFPQYFSFDLVEQIKKLAEGSERDADVVLN